MWRVAHKGHKEERGDSLVTRLDRVGRMKRGRGLVPAVFWLASAVCLLIGSAAAKPVPTSVCEIARSPASFDGKLVRLRATVVSGFEAFGIDDPNNKKCGMIWLSYPGGGPVASTSFGPATPNLQRPPVRLKNDRQLKRFQELLDAHMYPRSRGTDCIGCGRYNVTATFTGRLDYAGKGHGFGHLNAYKTRLVLESVSNVSALDLASHYDPRLFSPTPVHLPTGYLKGRVINPQGRPVASAEIDATSTEDVPLYLRSFYEWTDDKGRFKIGVPPGTYVLGLNLESPPSAAFPFPPTYYPGTSDVRRAEKLSVSDRQSLNGLVIRISGRLRQRKVPVKVTWPDGKPVGDANVWLAEISNPRAVVGGAVSHTAADGTFDLIGFEGIGYFIHADIYAKPRYTPYCAAVKTLEPGDLATDQLVMVLSRKGEVCRSE
jgi:hypothetical protein